MSGKYLEAGREIAMLPVSDEGGGDVSHGVKMKTGGGLKMYFWG